MYIIFKIALRFKLMSQTSPVYTYLHAGTGLCTSFTRFTYFKYSFKLMPRALNVMCVTK